jgi:hypothetical protein
LDIARNINTPVPILKELANDPDISIRRAVAENPTTPFNTRIALTLGE